jgi:predicted alpha/beta-fold hydrolase
MTTRTAEELGGGPAGAAARGEAARPAREEVAAAWWIPGPHMQTTWGRFARSRRLVTFEREVLTTPDDDDLVLDHLAGPPGSPRVLLLHGLEGSSQSVYAQGLASLVARAGWRCTVLHFRSCARDPRRPGRWLPNRRPRLYHSGDTADLDFAARALAAREPETPLYAVGVSLGGNALLKWLGENGARSPVEAAATISVPYDLALAARHLEHGARRLYASHFLKTLKAKALDVMARFPRETEHMDPDRIRFAQTFREFDDRATAPLHGFTSADNYYLKSSSQRFLARIEVPTFCINSSDDPFLPEEVLARARDAASDDVTFKFTPWGGHAAFITGRWPWRPTYWAEEQAIAWLVARPA